MTRAQGVGPGGALAHHVLVQVQNLGCYPIQNVTLHMALPALGHRQATILSVTHVVGENVSVEDT